MCALLKLLEQYRNGEGDLPTYEELQQIAAASCTQANAPVVTDHSGESAQWARQAQLEKEERAAFEAWACNHSLRVKRYQYGAYVYKDTRCAWQAWLGRAAVPAKGAQ